VSLNFARVSQVGVLPCYVWMFRCRNRIHTQDTWCQLVQGCNWGNWGWISFA